MTTLLKLRTCLMGSIFFNKLILSLLLVGIGCVVNAPYLLAKIDTSSNELIEIKDVRLTKLPEQGLQNFGNKCIKISFKVNGEKIKYQNFYSYAFMYDKNKHKIKSKINPALKLQKYKRYRKHLNLLDNYISGQRHYQLYFPFFKPKDAKYYIVVLKIENYIKLGIYPADEPTKRFDYLD